MTEQQAMRMALEALEQIDGAMPFPVGRSAITALRQALANQALERMAENARELGLDYDAKPDERLMKMPDEPVAWMNAGHLHEIQQARLPYAYMYPKEGAGAHVPLYTRPQPAAWVGLDRKEMLTIIDREQADTSTGLPMFYRDQCMIIARAIEAKLKEKNT